MNRILIGAVIGCLAFWVLAVWGLLHLARYIVRGF